jgi:hypothetical protein
MPARKNEDAEHACPKCGKPVLESWGTLCASCKPKLASPKTMVLASDDVAGMLSMTLGWLVVTRCPDDARRGTLIELVDPVMVLTRAGATASKATVIELNDDFISTEHATIRRPQGYSQEAAFTIEDRKHPSPSANGTFVNGRRLGPSEVVKLGDGDMVRVGTTDLCFKSLWLPPALPPSA